MYKNRGKGVHFFQYRNDELFCEGISVGKIAQHIGTPFYLYSHATLERHYRVFDEAFAKKRHLVCYAVKANSNIAILRTFAQLGAGADIVSGGELFRSLQAGIPPSKIVYSGVGKTSAEIEYAIKEGILMFNVESAQELELLNDSAGRLGKKPAIALRINPDVDPQTHPKISTGLKENKFGLDIKEAPRHYQRARELENVEAIGMSCHIGSQLTKIEPFIDALKRIKVLIGNLRQVGIAIEYLDMGGGLGITYLDEEPPSLTAYANAIIEELKDLDVTLLFEPGRVLVGNAGILVTKVLYTKTNQGKNFIVVDAAMNDLIRPSFYEAFHAIEPVRLSSRKLITADIVGPICETGDYLARGRCLQLPERGDLLAVMSAGAYGFTMSSNYNSRPRIPEVLVIGKKAHVIRKREAYADLSRLEKIPKTLVKEK